VLRKGLRVPLGQEVGRHYPPPYETALDFPLLNRLMQLFSDGPLVRSVQVAPGVAVGSVKGPARTDNQDRAFVANITRGNNPLESITIGAVCDGMGGMLDGGAAAALAASSFITGLVSSNGHLEDRLYSAVLSANLAVYQRYHGRGGTTLTALALNEIQNGFVVHVGDTRLYQRTSKELTLLTVDDTLQGIIGEQSIRANEDNLDNQLVQFVGIGDELEPHVVPLQEGNRNVTPDSAWLVTSDGAHGLGRQMLQAISANATSASDLIRKLMFVADAAGLHDNATAVGIFPNDLFKSQTFHDGITLSIWTPTTSLELWIDPGAKPIPPSRAIVSKAPPKQKARRTVAKTKVRATPKKRRSNLVRILTNQDQGKVPDDPGDNRGPQLNITFGGSAEQNND